MIHPIPSGTRDVLPDETRELRAITDALRGAFERRGYGELYTPALEYESVLQRAEMAEASPAYRLFDETGTVLALRSDMTVPIARVVATRYANAEPPLRFCYFAHCYRGVTPQRGQLRELLQAGIELVGAPAPQGTAEVLTVICDSLDAVGLEAYRIGVGDASLYPRLMSEVGLDEATRRAAVEALAMRDIVGLEHCLRGCGLDDAAVQMLLEVAHAAAAATRSSAFRRELARPRAVWSTCSRCSTSASAAGSSWTSAWCATSATTPGRCSRSMTPRSACRSAAADATTTCSDGLVAACRRSGSRSA